MSRPICKLSIAGKPVSSLFMSRLVSCTVVDKEGVANDTIDIVLEDEAPSAAMPPKGDIITCNMGSAEKGVAFMGRFKVEQVDGTCFPHTLHITGKSADMRAKMKENKERHWDKKTVGDIVKQVAGDHGLGVQIAASVSDHKYEWFGQNGVSDIHMLENLARRHNALFTVKNGKILFVERGQGQSASGAALTGLVIAPPMIQPGTFNFTLPDHGSYKDVRAYWQDKDKVRRVEVRETSNDKAKATMTLGEPYESEEEAKRAAKSKAKALKRGTGGFSCSIIGDPTARGGAPVSTRGVRQGIDGVEHIIETATHNFSKSKFETAISAKLKA